MAATRDRVGLPELRLNGDAAPAVEFVGPKETKRPRVIKLDITGDELVIDGDNRSAILNRYEDQPDAPPLRVYSLAETTAEKLRSMMQRLQCRDLYDTWYLLEHAGVDPIEIKADFEAKTRHRNFDPSDFPPRFERRLAEYRQRWTRELSPYTCQTYRTSTESSVRPHDTYVEPAISNQANEWTTFLRYSVAIAPVNLLSAVMEAIDEVANRMSQSRVDENPAH